MMLGQALYYCSLSYSQSPSPLLKYLDSQTILISVCKLVYFLDCPRTFLMHLSWLSDSCPRCAAMSNLSALATDAAATRKAQVDVDEKNLIVATRMLNVQSSVYYDHTTTTFDVQGGRAREVPPLILSWHHFRDHHELEWHH